MYKWMIVLYLGIHIPPFDSTVKVCPGKESLHITSWKYIISVQIEKDQSRFRPDVVQVIVQIGRGERGWGRGEESAVLTDCAMLCLCVCCRALSDCVYFAEGHFTSGSLGMNEELISPTETSQSLRIYSPPLQWPLPSRPNNGTR